ncbi:MAG TPA: hypothetical protein VHT50_09950 [Mycobacterium sp.]|nr:hypothetical protein [Mycobacterium sp.]
MTAATPSTAASDELSPECAEWVRRAVDDAPPLTDEQRAGAHIQSYRRDARIGSVDPGRPGRAVGRRPTLVVLSEDPGYRKCG